MMATQSLPTVRVLADGRVVIGIGMVVGQVRGRHRCWTARSPTGVGGGQYATRIDAIRGLARAMGYSVRRDGNRLVAEQMRP